MKPASPAALFGFLLLRTFLGAARRRLRRLKEPRYILGTAFALLYFATVFGRSARRGPHAAMSMGELPPIVLVVASFALTALSLVTWVLRSSRAALPLSEAEIQFLFPAPLTRRSVVRFALLRGQLAILVGALIISLVYRSGGSLASLLPAWMILATINLHGQGIGFTKARWNERSAGRRAALLALGTLAPLAALALAIAGLLSSLDALHIPALVARAASLLLLPARVLLTPMLTLHGHASLTVWLGALGIVLLHFVWVDRSATRFEEATLAFAARRAEMRRRQGGRLAALPAEAARARVPFPLASTGAPEAAILWKNLLGVRRTPLGRQALLLGLLALGVFGGAAALVAWQPAQLLSVQTAVVVCLAGGVFVALISPLVQREDFRSDLALAEVLRTWPVAPARLAAGELAAPLAVTCVRLSVGLVLALALSLGGAAGLRIARAFVGFPERQALVEFASPASLIPWLVAAAILVPVLAALLLVLQNAATLAFPAWFPPGPRRAAGPEVTGMRIISFLATTLLVALALVPSAILVGLAAWLGSGLGPRFLPALAPIAALPLALEVAAGIWVLGKLLERYDPALEATS